MSLDSSSQCGTILTLKYLVRMLDIMPPSRWTDNSNWPCPHRSPQLNPRHIYVTVEVNVCCVVAPDIWSATSKSPRNSPPEYLQGLTILP